MSNTSSNKTSKTNRQTVKVIVGEIGRDTKTGILGRGYSYDNGATFHVTDTMFGRLYDKDDGERMWPNMAHKVADEIKSATADLPNVRKQADEAVKFAESAIAASKVNSDAIVAQSSAVAEAKSAMDSATAEIQQLKANAASDVARIESTIAEVQAGVNQAKSANESAVQAVQAELKLTSDSMDKVEKRLDEVDTSLDTYAKSAAEQGHDITLIKQKQGQFEADFASAQGNVNQIQVDIKGLSQNIKDNQGNIASLLTSADKLQASMTDAEKNISNLLLTASKYEQTFKDQDGRLSKVEQTATEHTSELADAKGNIDKVTQKADNLQLLLSDAQKNIQNIQLDAKGLHDTLTGQGNQLANLNVTLSNLDSKYSGITGDLQSKQTALSTEQQQTKDMLLRKADKSEVDNVKGTVNQVSAEQKVIADQITQKVSSEDFKTLAGKVDGAITSISKNTTAINQTNKQIVLKADQTDVNSVKKTATQNSARLDTMANEIKLKVSSTDVNNIVDGKGYATTSTVQSLITQEAGTINENITNLDAKYSAKDGVNLATKTGNVSLSGVCNASRNIGDISLDVINELRGKYMTISVDVEWNGWESGANFNRLGWEIQLIYEDGSPADYYGAWLTPTTANGKQRISGTYMVPDKEISSLAEGNAYIEINCTNAKVSCLKIERGTVATPWTPAPSDNATVTQLQSVTASIDGLQSNVTNYQNDTSSRFTQLSSLMQSKVGTADFEQLKRSVDMQTLDSADINNMRTNGHYFVRSLANSPIAGWVYVDVTGNGNDRIRQDVYQDGGNQHKYRRWFGTYWTGWDEGATYTEITQLQDAVNLRVQKGELLSQINLTAGNTLIQSNKLYLDASSVVFSGRAFIPSAAIASLSADKVNTGWLNTNNVSLGDGRTRIRADHDYMYIQPTGSAASNTGIRMGYSGLDFLTNVIPNGYNSSVPYYSIGYDGASNGYLRISAFDHINPGGATATQNWYTMVDAISLNNSEINFAAKGNMHMQVVNGGVNIKPTLFFQNNTNNGTYAGFTRLDNSDTVEFNTGNNNGENFHVNSGARFMQYVYINGYARAQGWLTNSTLSKKTNIRKLDTQVALDKIRQDDQYLYEYKRNVAQGIYDPQASFIIDDVNDVSHYSVPREFIDQSGNYREPNVELAYLIAAFQAIDKQVQLQQAEIKELKEKLQHE